MAKLPIMTHPTFDVIIPSTKLKTKIRPMTVKEEKILLMAKESENPSDIFGAVTQVVSNCLTNGDIKAADLALFDIEYLFLRIRALSIDNVVELSYIDKEDEKEYSFKLDLDKVEVRFPEKKEMIIKIGNDEGFRMRYPKASIYATESFTAGNAKADDLATELIIASMESYFRGNEFFAMKDNTRAEIITFLENLDINVYNKLREFVANIPTLFHEFKYTNSKGTERTITLSSLSDFFIL